MEMFGEKCFENYHEHPNRESYCTTGIIKEKLPFMPGKTTMAREKIEEKVKKEYSGKNFKIIPADSDSVYVQFIDDVMKTPEDNSAKKSEKFTPDFELD